MSTAEQVKAHADKIELRSCDFVDKRGVRAGGYEKCSHVRLGFIDGKFFTLTRDEFGKLADYQFKLRPTRNNS